MILPEMNKKKKAFSLIEISVILIVISVLISITISSSQILQVARINAARNITKSSIAKDIDGMILWLESTSVDSFDDEYVEDGDEVTNWNDIKDSHLDSYIATSPTNKPTYDEDALNKLPGVSFNGIDDFLQIDNFAANAYMTLFVVGDFSNTSSESFAIEHSATTTSNNGFYFYGHGDTYPGRVKRSGDSTATVNSGWFGSDIGIGTMRYDGTNISYKLNNNSFTNTADSDAENSIVIDTLYIGSRGGTSIFTNGALGEIIMYDKALTDDEVDDVVEYLNKKWKIY